MPQEKKEKREAAFDDYDNKKSPKNVNQLTPQFLHKLFFFFWLNKYV